MDMLDGILEAERRAQAIPAWQKWAGRETMPEALRPLLDAFVRMTGIKPGKRDLLGWLQEADEWSNAHLTAADIEAAYQHAARPDGGFLVSSPMSLTKTAKALKAKRAQAYTGLPSVEATMQKLSQPDPVYVPMPEEARAALRTYLNKRATR